MREPSEPPPPSLHSLAAPQIREPAGPPPNLTSFRTDDPMVGRAGMVTLALDSRVSTSSTNGSRPGRKSQGSDAEEQSCHTPAASKGGRGFRRSRIGVSGGDPAFHAPAGQQSTTNPVSAQFSVGESAVVDGISDAQMQRVLEVEGWAELDYPQNPDDKQERWRPRAFDVALALLSVAAALVGLKIMGIQQLPALLRTDVEGGQSIAVEGLLGLRKSSYWHGTVWPDCAGNYLYGGLVGSYPCNGRREPEVAVVDCPYENCCSLDSTFGWLIKDCEGLCVPALWQGDGTCDIRLACAALNYDGGDCVFDAHDLPAQPEPEPQPYPQPDHHPEPQLQPEPGPQRPSPPPPPAPMPSGGGPQPLSGPEPEPVPEPTPAAQPPDNLCYDHYDNCNTIAAQYPCTTNMADLAPNNDPLLLSYACCATCTPQRATPPPPPPVLPAHDGSCAPVQNTAYQGTHLAVMTHPDYVLCCEECSQRPSCMGWSFRGTQCTLFSQLQSSVSVFGAVSSHNRCWNLITETYLYCCEDVGITCRTALPQTCSQHCDASIGLFMHHCAVSDYSHIVRFFGRGTVGLFPGIHSLCDGTALHTLPGCTNPASPNWNSRATTDDGSCIVHNPPPPPAMTVPGCPYVHCCGGTAQAGWRVFACTGDCVSAAGIFDSDCDQEFNCEIYDYDRHRCTPPPPPAPPPPVAGGTCAIDPDTEQFCPDIVSQCDDSQVRAVCPTTCAFGTHALACADPCRCTTHGLSGEAPVPIGCGIHLNDYDPICYLADPAHCVTGLPAPSNPLVKWRHCDPSAEGGFVPTCFDGVRNQHEVRRHYPSALSFLRPVLTGGTFVTPALVTTIRKPRPGQDGIDCGGECAQCVSICAAGDTACMCHDGFLTPGEIGVDCGGPVCPPCPPSNRCSNGQQDGDEVGIDCGGSACPACPTPPSCHNGRLDGQEVDIDCGGLECDACQPCMCTSSGTSGGTSTPFVGCGSFPRVSPLGNICFVVEPRRCTPSSLDPLGGAVTMYGTGNYAGAGWRRC
jgi:hypothetical protein